MEILKQTIRKPPKTTEDRFTIQFTYSTTLRKCLLQYNPQQLRHGLNLTVGLTLQMPLLVCCLENRGQGQETFSLIYLNLSP